MDRATIEERFAYYWTHRSQMNMGWVVELWPGWQVKWSGWNAKPSPVDGVWDAEWRAVPVKAGTATLDASRSTVSVPAQALVEQHGHDDRMTICLSAFTELVAKLEQQSPTVGHGQ